jgi:hypothetical protein
MIESFNRNAVAPAVWFLDANDSTALRLRIFFCSYPTWPKRVGLEDVAPFGHKQCRDSKE